MKCIIFSLIISLASVSWASDRIELFVSPDGNDSAIGSKDNPVATITRALRLAQSDCGQLPVTIYLREGKHRVTEPVIIGPEYSGSKDCPVVITSWPGEKAVVSSSVPLSCDWKDSDGGIMAASVAAGSLGFDRLFVNGDPRPMARYPDRDTTINIFEGYAPDAIDRGRVARWKNPVGGYIHAMHSSEWGGYQYTIEGKNDNGELKLGAGFQNNRMAGMHPRYRMVENIFEELDAPGEWYFDKTSSRLLYIPLSDENIHTASIETPCCESLFVLKGDKDSPVRYVSIRDIELAETERTFLKTDEPLLRSDWKIYRGGAVLFENTENCSLTDCYIHDIGGNAVFFSGYNRSGSVRRNHIEHIGASAICFVGLPSSVRSPLFEYKERQDWNTIDKVPGPCGNDYPALCDATDNLVHSIGEVEKQGAGIQISMAMDITVSHNSIYRLPRAGINISEGTWGGHVIEWNDVFDTVLETGDHGSFNSWGRDRYWHPKRRVMDSVAAKNPDAPFLDAIHTTVIRNNRWRCDHGWDIDLDDGSTNYHIYNNLCLNGGLKLREGFRRIVENNVIVNNSFHPHVWFAGSGDEFRHNVVTTAYKPIQIADWGPWIDHNIFASETDLEAARNNGTDIHSVYGNPLFIDPESGDYRVGDGSIALQTGFRNFPMDSFGVMHPPLREIAETPLLPRYAAGSLHDASDDGHSFVWNGISFKTVMTEGERSATGIAAVKGVLVTANSNAAIDMRPNDVILEVDGFATDDAATLRNILRKARNSSVKAVRFRDQQAGSVSIDCRSL